MRKLAQAAAVDPRIRTLAASIAAGYSRDYEAQAAALCRWVAAHVAYVRDPVGVEAVTPPAYLLSTLAGDCDDHATLLAAMLLSVGIPARFVAGGRAPGRMVHVWTEAQVGGEWMPLETTVPTWQPGRAPPLPYRMESPI